MLRQSWTNAVCAALIQSGLPEFLPDDADRLLEQVMPAKCSGLEPHLAGPTRAVPLCVSWKGPAWPAIIGVALQQASPTSPLTTQGVTHSAWGGVANATR